MHAHAQLKLKNDNAAIHESDSPLAPQIGITVPRVFSREGLSPFECVDWAVRTAVITNERGEEIFRQDEVEVPEQWSQMATNVVASKYFRATPGHPLREWSVRQLIGRVADTIAGWGEADGYFSTKEQTHLFRDELSALLLEQYGAFNSPVWFNVGVEPKPQCSACFILSADDTMESLLELQRAEAMLFKYGSGAGSNLSRIRSRQERLSGGGIPSGPVSFMRGYDAWAGTIKSGGKTRRAAKMQILDVDHPDISEFIQAKPQEEAKARALIAQGYDGGFNVSGGAYESVFFQNANLSVRVSDEFMEAVERGDSFATRFRTTGEIAAKLDAGTLLRELAAATWLCGDPGIQFDTTINRWHTCPQSGRINASNPCSEYMHVDDSACNLASLNLLKFLNEDGSFDLERYRRAIDLFILAQDILIENAGYPMEKIGRNARRFRQLGLGYANLGALLMTLGLPYDSDEGRAIAAQLTALLSGEAYRMSAAIAAARGAFDAYADNREAMLDVIRMHTDAAHALPPGPAPLCLAAQAARLWEEALALGERHGYRNSQVTVLAPTGTIAFLMDCDTTGIEPDIALVKYKKLVGGGLLKIVNQGVPRALSRLGYRKEQIEQIVRYIDEHDTIEGAPELRSEHLPIFDCAFRPQNGVRFIDYRGHLKMMAAVQPFLSGAISKTVNLPEAATVDEIYEAYRLSWKLGLKAVAIYRDNSKGSQPLSTAAAGAATVAGATKGASRRRLPDERSSITHKFSVAGHEGYLTVGLYEDGTPGEIFLVMAKEGSTLSGVMDAFATSISLALQYGVPLQTLIKKFAHTRFEPSGFTANRDIPLAKSVLDYIFRWLGLKFLPLDAQADLGILPAGTAAKETASNGIAAGRRAPTGLQTAVSDDAPPCTSCGSSLMVRQGSCYRCLNCGSQGGCG